MEGRSDPDIQRLLQKPLEIKTLQVFKDIGIVAKDLDDACQMLSYEFRGKGEKVFENGEQDDKMYIILDGSVQMSINMEKNPLKTS